MRIRWSVLALLIAVAACASDEPTAPPTFEEALCIRGIIALGDTVNATLASTDCDLADVAGGQIGYFESYHLNVAADTTVDISMASGEFDTYLFLLKIRTENIDSLEVVAFNDDIVDGVDTNSLIDSVPLLAADDYLVITNGFRYSDVGAFSVSVVGP